MKKFLIVSILIMAIITAGFPVNAASDKVAFTVDAPSELPKAGEEFEVSVSISNNPGFCAVQFVLQYDKAVMTCDEIFLEDILAGAISATNPDNSDGAIIAAATLNPIENDGKLATYIFTAKEAVENLKFRINDVTLCDEERNDIEYEIVGQAEETDEAPVDRDESEPKEDQTAGNDYNDDAANSDDAEAEDDEKEVPGNIDGENSAETQQAEDESVEGETSKPSDEKNATESIFPDIKGHWAEEFITEAVELGLFKGNADGTFNPDANVTRAQFVTTLWRMAGTPDASKEYPFKDIEDQIPEFKSAIAWAYANGYINGVSETAFDPNGTLTREAGMKILHYYSGGESGMELQLQAIYNAAFEDSSQISQWAKRSVHWGIYNKMIAGTSETTLSPQGTATRAQLAKILVNYLNIYYK